MLTVRGFLFGNKNKTKPPVIRKPGHVDKSKGKEINWYPGSPHKIPKEVEQEFYKKRTKTK